MVEPQSICATTDVSNSIPGTKRDEDSVSLCSSQLPLGAEASSLQKSGSGASLVAVSLGGGSAMDSALPPSQPIRDAIVPSPPTPAAGPVAGLAQRPSTGKGARSGKAVMSDMFWCCKCHQERPISLGVQRGSQQICDPDVKAYNSLTQRWKGKPNLRKWWNSKSESEQAEWYRKQQAHIPGTKRQFDCMRVSETSFGHAVRDDVKEDDWIPLNIYQRRMALEGVSQADSAQEFKRICERGDGMWRSGQWHVHDYQGFKMVTGSRESQGYAVSGTYKISGREDLSKRMEECAAKLDSQARAHDQSMSCLQVGPPRDAPNTQCPTNGGVSLPSWHDHFESSISREAH